MSYTVGRGTEIAQPGVDRPGEKLSLGVAARLSRYLQVLTQARKIGQGDDLLAGARRLHARELDADPPRPVAASASSASAASATTSSRSSPRSARSCAPRASTTSRCSAPAISAPRSRPRTSSPTTASASWPCSTSIRSKVGIADRVADGAPQLRAPRGRSRTRTSSSPCWRSRRPPPRSSRTISPTPASRSSSTTPTRCCRCPPEVTVHTSSPAVDLLYALYFYLT